MARLAAQESQLWYENRSVALQRLQEAGELPIACLSALSDGDMVALRQRAHALQAKELLSQSEYHAVEDLVADFIELRLELQHSLQPRLLLHTETSDAGGGTAAAAAAALVAKLHTSVGLSASFAEDEVFARQLRRKLLQGTLLEGESLVETI